MRKITSVFLIVVGVLSLIGCANQASDAQEDALVVYSFSGANEQFEISNGVIVLDADEETFYGGDLVVAQENLFQDMVSFTTTFYTTIDGEQRTILSNSVVDETGGSVNMEGSLGKASGDGFIIGNKVDRIDDLSSNLWFELKTVDEAGKENVYQLQLNVTEITQEGSGTKLFTKRQRPG